MITGLYITDVDPNDDPREVSISVGYGWLQLIDSTGITIQGYLTRITIMYQSNCPLDSMQVLHHLLVLLHWCLLDL